MENFDKRINDAMYLAKRSGFTATAEALAELLASQNRKTAFVATDSSNINSNTKGC